MSYRQPRFSSREGVHSEIVGEAAEDVLQRISIGGNGMVLEGDVNGRRGKIRKTDFSQELLPGPSAPNFGITRVSARTFPENGFFRKTEWEKAVDTPPKWCPTTSKCFMSYLHYVPSFIHMNHRPTPRYRNSRKDWTVPGPPRAVHVIHAKGENRSCQSGCYRYSTYRYRFVCSRCSLGMGLGSVELER